MAAGPIPDADSAGYLEILECERGLNDIDEILRTTSIEKFASGRK
jgi:hypothetical protein